MISFLANSGFSLLAYLGYGFWISGCEILFSDDSNQESMDSKSETASLAAGVPLEPAARTLPSVLMRLRRIVAGSSQVSLPYFLVKLAKLRQILTDMLYTFISGSRLKCDPVVIFKLKGEHGVCMYVCEHVVACQRLVVPHVMARVGYTPYLGRSSTWGKIWEP